MGDDQPRAHVPVTIGGRDDEGYRTFEPVGEACYGCSDPDAGRWVPVSQCPAALAVFDAEDTDPEGRPWRSSP